MNTWIRTWSTTAVSAGLALGVITFGAASVAAEPSDNASCTAGTVITGTQAPGLFGEIVRENAGPEFEPTISEEARSPPRSVPRLHPRRVTRRRGPEL